MSATYVRRIAAPRENVKPIVVGRFGVGPVLRLSEAEARTLVAQLQTILDGRPA